MLSKINKTYLTIGIVLLVLIILAIVLTIWRSNLNRIALVTNPNQEKVLLPKLLADNQTLYYYSPDKNELKKWNLKNKTTETWLKLPFKDTNDIVYSPDLTKALVKTENPLNAAERHVYLVDLTNKKILKQLSDNILTINWSPDSKRIAYHYLDWNGTADQIAIANPDGTNEVVITPVAFENISLVWADNENLIYYNMPSEAFKAELNLISIATKKAQLITDQYYLGNIVKIDTNKFLIDATTRENANTTLNILDLTTKKLTDLKSTSSVTKSFYSKTNNLIYATYNKYNTADTSDLLQTINLQNNKISSLPAKSKDIIQASHLMLTTDNKILYLLSKNALYQKKL